MPFKITVIDKLGENVLHKCGDSARVKAELIFKDGNEMFGQNHISYTERGGYSLRKSVEIYDVVAA